MHAFIPLVVFPPAARASGSCPGSAGQTRRLKLGEAKLRGARARSQVQLGNEKAGGREPSAFSLIEMLVAMAVLSILVLAISTIMTSSSTAISVSRKQMDADTQARLIFNRMAGDFQGMIKNGTTDILAYHNAEALSDDALFFYSHAPGYFDAGAAGQSPVSLIGYRINSNFQLERLGKGMTWDGGNGATPTSSVLSLTWDSTANPAKFDPATLLTGLNKSIDSPPNSDKTVTSSLEPKYQVIGDQVFRLAICYQLSDGTFSSRPVLTQEPAGWDGNKQYSQPSVVVPDSNVAGVLPNSRWFNTTSGEGFICTATSSTTASGSIWAGLGLRDVRAIVVTLAILDNNTRRFIVDPPYEEAKTYPLPLKAKMLLAIGGIHSQLVNVTETELAPQKVPSSTSPPTLPAQKWGNLLGLPGPGISTTQQAANYQTFVGNVGASGVIPAVASQVRIYQRFFYLEP